MIREAEIDRFFQLVFGNPCAIDGWWSFWTYNAETEIEDWARTVDRSQANARALAVARSRRDVFVGVGIRERFLGEAGRGGSDDVIALPGFWADVDVGEEGHQEGFLRPVDITQALEKFTKFEFEPTLLVNSGGGVHAWFLFDQLWDIKDKNDRALAQRMSIEFEARFRKLWEEENWHLDKVSDLARVLRVAGTENWKTGTPRQVEFLYTDGPRYSLQDFSALKKSNASLFAPGASAAPMTKDIIAPGLTSSQLKRLQNIQEKKESQELVNKALAGEALAPRGGRNTELNRLAGVVAYTLKRDEITPETFVQWITPSLEAMEKASDDPKNGPPTKKQAYQQFLKGQADARASLAEERRILAKLRGVPDGLEPYTKGELEYFTKKQRCTVEEFGKRWIIQIAHSFYVFVDGKYTGPFLKDSLIHLPELLARAPIVWEYVVVNTKGETTKQKTMLQIVAEYGTVALKLEADLALQESYFQLSTRTFHSAICPLRPLAPEFNNQVDTWLRLLGGADSDKLLDWVATVTKLDFQTCALYFSGEPGSGKGLFAKGVARLWHEGPPTQLSFVVGTSFNADIGRCPVIFGDEHVSTPSRWVNMSAELRALVGSSSRIYSEKYQVHGILNGAVRLILAANNDRLLVSDEDLGKDDLDAITSRFLHIKPKESTAQYLLDIGGPWYIGQQWIEGDALAKHALWLRDNRTVVSKGRFLVEGSRTELHRSLVTEGFTNGLVCEWIARFLMNPKVLLTSKGAEHVWAGRGELLISTAVVVDFWDMYIANYKAPTTTRIGRVLTNLSVNSRREASDGKKKFRFHVINLELVYNWAHRNHIGDKEAMQEFINSDVLWKAPNVVGINSQG